MPTLPIPVFVALILGFACLRLLQEQRRATALGLLLAICALQSLIIALTQHYMIPGMRWVQPITASLIPPVAWLACQTTAVRSAGRSDLLHGLVPVLALAAILVAPEFLDVLLPGAFAGYGIAILVQSLRGADAQPRALLANDNIPARIWLVIGTMLIASAVSDGLILLAQVTGDRELRPWIITVFSVGNLLLIGLFSLSPYLRSDPAEPAEPPGASAEPDAEIWARVLAYMDREKPYLDPDLTLMKLARRLGIPAKTLSATINLSTGENVSRFVNRARIRDAQAAILRGETVTGAMLSSGFNTKSNFNREFLRVAGANPSDWLQAQPEMAGKSA